MKKIIIKLVFLFSLSLSLLSSKAQILDIPYRRDLTGCGLWCWGMASHMIIVYYSNDVKLCDVLEVARLQDTTRFGSVNCCTDPYGNCCNSNYPEAKGDILRNWSISNSYYYNPTHLSYLQSYLQDNRPFLMHLFNYPGMTNGHVVVAYGIVDNDILFHNPGNGSQIRSYTDLKENTIQRWENTHIMNISATTCLHTQNVTGVLNGANSKYKAKSLINANCVISNNSSIEFLSENDVILNGEFEIQLGSTMLINTGNNLICP